MAIPLISFRNFNILIGSFVILFGIYLNFVTFDFFWLAPLGFVLPKYFSIDFFPLFPWFGVVLIGIGLGHFFYPKAKRRYHFSINPELSVLKNICFLGRHSLHVYFFHQPVLFAIIFFLLFQFS